MKMQFLSKAALCAAGASLASLSALAAPPKPDHVIIVIEENHSYNEILGASSPATWIKALAASGASFTNSFAIEHPSQPNYLDLYSGANQGTTGSDSFPANTPFTTANLGAQLRSAGYSFAGYSQGLPSVGSTVNTSGNYAHKHNPWANWQSSSPTGNQLPSSTNQPFTNFPTDYTTLPTVSFVVPDLQNDMHDGTIAAGDTWCKNNLDGYAQWAATHNSLLILTFDEDDSSESNQIATIFSGAKVKPGQYTETINHYSVLATVEDMYGLSRIGGAVGKTAITDAFVVPEPAMIVWSLAAIAMMRTRGRGKRRARIC